MGGGVLGPNAKLQRGKDCKAKLEEDGLGCSAIIVRLPYAADYWKLVEYSGTRIPRTVQVSYTTADCADKTLWRE